MCCDFSPFFLICCRIFRVVCTVFGSWFYVFFFIFVFLLLLDANVLLMRGILLRYFFFVVCVFTHRLFLSNLHLLTPGHIHRGNGITWRGFTQTTIKIWFDAGKFQKIKIMVCTCVYIHICQIRFSGAFGREWWESKWGLWGWKFHHLHYSRSFRMIARARMCFTGEGWRLVSWCPSGSKTMYSWFYLFIRIWIIFCVCFVV